MPEDLSARESIQGAFDHSEDDEYRDARELVGKDLQHLGLSEKSIKLVDLTLFLRNAARSNIIKHNWETPSPPLAMVSSEFKQLLSDDPDTIKTELVASRIYLESLLDANRAIPQEHEMGALPEDVQDRLEQKTLPAISLTLNHFIK